MLLLLQEADFVFLVYDQNFTHLDLYPAWANRTTVVSAPGQMKFWWGARFFGLAGLPGCRTAEAQANP